MNLNDLDPQFVKYVTQSLEQQFAEGRGAPAEFLRHVGNVQEAQGIVFLCPACFTRNGGAVGTHAIEVSFDGKGVKDHQGSHNRQGKPSRWTVSGSTYEDLTLRPSILIDPCEPTCGGWHGFITNGEVK